MLPNVAYYTFLVGGVCLCVCVCVQSLAISKEKDPDFEKDEPDTEEAQPVCLILFIKC